MLQALMKFSFLPEDIVFPHILSHTQSVVVLFSFNKNLMKNIFFNNEILF